MSQRKVTESHSIVFPNGYPLAMYYDVYLFLSTLFILGRDMKPFVVANTGEAL